MVLKNKIFISEIGIENLVFNQRAPHIELFGGENVLKLTLRGIEGWNK